MSTDRGMSMTITEFREFLINGGSVEYCLPEQRNELAKFIQDEMGFPIGPGTYEYMVRHPDGRDYMVVELHDMGDMVVCSFCVHSLGRTVPFEQVSRLMSLANAPLDNRTDEEFLEAFTALMN